MKFKLIIIFFLLGKIIFAQGEPITIIGDSLMGRIVNGESIREVMGNVILRQGNITITCQKAVQYLSRNDAFLEGNVVVTQNNLTIEAPQGYYFGDEKIAEGKSGVKLNDGEVILTAINGNYNFNEQKAFFSDSVKLYDTVSTLTCNKLTYFKNDDKAIAVENVKIQDSVNTITADSLVHFRETAITFAEKNVKVVNNLNNAILYGNHLENYGEKKYSLVENDPLLIQIDSTENGIDTLVISALKLESYNDSTKKFIATDSVKIVRGNFASINDYTIFLRNEDKIITYKISEEKKSPILWYENSQLSGDTVNIYLENNELKKLIVKNNAFVLSQNENFDLRFDQISGDELIMYFDSSGISNTNVEGGVLSIYYTYDNNEPNGLTKSSSQSAKIKFNQNKVSEVRLYTSPASEYYPENLVKGNEQSFTLPSFVIYKAKPEKKDLLKQINLEK